MSCGPSAKAVRAALLLAVTGTVGSSCTHLAPAGGSIREAEVIKRTELLRLKLLVAGDVNRARSLHASDFQLVNPAGGTVTREEYLGALVRGYLDYLRWDAGPIDVRVAGRLAVIRYRSQLQVSLAGKPRPVRPHWHTDFYEKRNGRWVVVWSQATEVR